MSNRLIDTPSIARSYCPGCEPNTDPREEILDVRWCETHCLNADGAEDQQVDPDTCLNGSAEAGGAANKAWCDFLHRKDKRLAGLA